MPVVLWFIVILVVVVAVAVAVAVVVTRPKPASPAEETPAPVTRAPVGPVRPPMATRALPPTGTTPTPASGRPNVSLLSETAYNAMTGRGAPSKELFSYRSFMTAWARFPEFASGPPDVAKREIAALMAHVRKEVAFDYTEQLCNSGNPRNCRAVMGDASPNYGRGAIQLTGEPNIRAYSQAVFGDDRIVRDPDTILRDPSLFWGSALWFYMTRLAEHMRQDPPHFAMTHWRTCCWCVLHDSDDVQKRGTWYKENCRILGVDPGPDARIFASGRMTSDPC